jgi:pre-rRNA-processing protein RIX1
MTVVPIRSSFYNPWHHFREFQNIIFHGLLLQILRGSHRFLVWPVVKVVMQQDASFRAIVNRLNTTSVEELPRVAAFLASSLATCPLETYFSDAKTNTASVTAHKLKTRISALLQDRSQAGRLSAAIFIKTVIETAGSNLLAGSEPWARGLLSCLSKSEPPEIKKLYLTTITRIFLLTQHEPALIREITTPLLPSFLTTALGLIRPIVIKSSGQSLSASSPLLDTVLQCWLHLLPQHASTFRPFLNRIKPICLSLIEDHSTPQCTVELSTQILCSLISCAPKNTAGQEWTLMSGSIIGLAHETANSVFRAILEEHESNNSSLKANAKKHNFSKAPGTTGKDLLGLAAWKGVSEGSSRIAALISWLQNLLSAATVQQIPVPFGEVLDLTARILSVNVLESQGGPGHNLRYHNEASKEEKEELLLNLPKLHISCLALLSSLCVTYQQSLLPLHRTICDQILFQFQGMAWHQGVRRLCYDVIGHIMSIGNLSELEFNQNGLSTLAAQACNDLKSAVPRLDPNKHQSNPKELPSATNTTRSQDWYSVQRLLNSHSNAFASAWKLFPVLLGSGATSILPRQLRTEVDRLAILLDHREAMLASVLNPVVSEGGNMSTASILPFLTRSATDTVAVEALLRPRFPFIQTQVARAGDPDPDAIADIPSPNNAEGGDILSQLENSLNEMDKGPNNADSAAIGANGLNHGAVPPIEPPLSAQKRPFEDLEEAEPRAAIKEQIKFEIRPPKRARPDELVDAMTSSVAYQVGTTADVPHLPDAKIGSNGATPNEQSLGLSVNKTASVEAPSAVNEGNHSDSDSSDFEIPKIDTGFDTDEEDDEDEEEEE